MKKGKRYIEVNRTELRTAYVALMQFRNDLIQKGIDPVDVNELIIRLVKVSRRWR